MFCFNKYFLAIVIVLISYYVGCKFLNYSSDYKEDCGRDHGQDSQECVGNTQPKKTESIVTLLTNGDVFSVVKHVLFRMSMQEIRDILMLIGRFDKLLPKIYNFMEDSDSFMGEVTKPFIKKRERHSSENVTLIEINPDNLKFVINDVGPAIQSQCGNLSILVYVHSASQHETQRDIIRKTWGNEYSRRKFKMVVVFFVGESLNTSIMEAILVENSKHHDIVQGNYLDTYHNITLKAISALKWIYSYCTNWDLILKTDDDIFVNLVNFHKLLFKELPSLYFNTNKMLLCKVIFFNMAQRDTDNKWYDPKDNYRYFNYPQYCQGSAYMMSSATAEALYQNSFGQEFHFIDDLVVTGMLAQKAGVSFFPLNPKYMTSEEDHSIDITLNHMNGSVVFSINLMSEREKLWDIVQPKLENLEDI